MADVKKKIKIRAGHKSHAKRIIAHARELIEARNPSESKKLKSLQSNLKDKIVELKDLDREIVELVEDERIEQEVADSCDFASAIHDCIVEIETALNEIEKGKEHSQHLTGSSSETYPNQSPPQVNNNHARLPKLELKKFFGDPVEWSPFWDSFSSAVHDNESLTEVDKFNYLKSLVQGQAANTISGFSLTGENYKEAIKLLKERYGNKQVLISAHMESLLKLPAATSLHETKKLRVIYDKLESYVRSLQNIGIKPEMYGSFLSPVVMSKIPEELRISITRDLPSDEWSLEPMLETFRKELQLREKCQYIPGASSNREPRFHAVQKRGVPLGQPSTISALYTDAKSDTHHGPWCTYCKGSHPSSNCNIVTNISARKQILHQKGKCFRCLRTGHLARQCEIGKTCHLCGLKRHASICDSQDKRRQPPQARTAVAGLEPPPSHAPVDTQAPATSMLVDSKNSVLLQTARANIFKPESSAIFVNARMVFDSCSQRSYVTENLKRALHLPVTGQETLMIKTFGEDSGKQRQCDVVQVAVGTFDGMKIYVTAYVVPLICAPISGQIVEFTQASYPHLQRLQLADETRGGDNLTIDLLIGADFYWQFVTGGVVRGPVHGPVALSTKLGYVLSGPVGISAPYPEDSTVNLTETHVLEICTTVIDEKLALDQQVKQFWDLETLGSGKMSRQFMRSSRWMSSMMEYAIK